MRMENTCSGNDEKRREERECKTGAKYNAQANASIKADKY